MALLQRVLKWLPVFSRRILNSTLSGISDETFCSKASFRQSTRWRIGPSSVAYAHRSAKEVNDILQGDLLLTKTALRSYPKVYWIWNHRRWCLQNIPDNPDGEPSSWQRATWAGELQTVEKILDFDPRNCELNLLFYDSSDTRDSPRLELPSLYPSVIRYSDVSYTRISVYGTQDRI